MQSSSPLPKAMLILNVDDTEAIRYSRSRTLTQAGYRVIEASTGEEALRMAATLHPELIVLDVNLPDIDGLEVCRRIKADHKTTRMMVLQVSSSRSSKLDLVMGLECGADSYLMEPIDPLELVATVRALLRLAHRQEDNLRLAAIVDSSQDAIVGKDLSGTITSWNRGAEGLFGYAADEMVGTPVARLIPCELRHEEDMILGRIARGERVESYETVRVKKGGTTIHVSLTVSPVKDATGRVIGASKIARDITERRRAEEALRKSEERFRKVFEHAATGIAITNWKGRFQQCNPAYCALLGYREEELCQRDFSSIVHPEDRAANLWEVRRVMKQEVPYFEGENRYVRKDGESVWVHKFVSVLRDPAGEQHHLLALVTDVTERRRAEERERRAAADARAAAEANAKFHTFFDQGSFFAGVMALDGTMLEANRLCLEACGFSRDAVIGKKFWDCGWWNRSPALMEMIRQGTREAANGILFRQESHYFVADGSQRMVDLLIAPVKDGEGRVLFLAPTGTDITDRKKAEQELRASEQFTLRITDVAPSMLYVYDMEERRNVWGNREMYVDLGYSDSQVQAMAGTLLETLLHPDDFQRYQRHAQRLAGLPDAEVAEFEYRVRHADGSWRWLHSRDMVFSRNAEGAVTQIVGSALDITERKQQEEELHRLKDDLERRVQDRTQELIVSQERLRSLSAQLAMAEQRERHKLARDLHDYLAQMLAVGQMKTAMAKKQPELSAASLATLQDLSTVFQQAMTYTRTLIAELSPPSLDEYGLSSALKWLGERMHKDGLSVEVLTDADQVPLSEEQGVVIFQCVRELLYNVLKHAGVDQATVQVSTDSVGYVRVIVRDGGCGMSEDVSRKAAQPGHLGLFAVRERMESIGGRMDVSSVLGQGTVVTLCLPLSGKNARAHVRLGAHS